MTFQVLLSTMFQVDHSIIDKMNIQSDAIIVNQCNENKFEKIHKDDYEISFISLNERGVGLSRNTALMRSSADICLFADDDEVFVDSYKEIICKAFSDNQKADIIIFNVPSTNPDRPSPHNNKVKRVRFYNCLRYATICIAIRNSSILKHGVYMSLLFGGGAKYSCGEDSLFLVKSIQSGLKIYTNPAVIATVSHNTSTWFNGHTDKFFIDQGAFYYAAFGRLGLLLNVFQLVRHHGEYQTQRSFWQRTQLVCRGAKEFREFRHPKGKQLMQEVRES